MKFLYFLLRNERILFIHIALHAFTELNEENNKKDKLQHLNDQVDTWHGNTRIIVINVMDLNQH